MKPRPAFLRLYGAARTGAEQPPVRRRSGRLGRTFAALVGGMTILALSLQPTAAPASDKPGKVFRLGALSPDPGWVQRFRERINPELARQGFVEGRNLIVDIRVGTTAGLPALAGELLAANPDAIIGNSVTAIEAIKSLSGTVPIVGSFIGEDPIAAGLAASLGRPGGNVTGILMLAPELDAKRLELLLEAVPSVRRVATLAVTATRAKAQLAVLDRVADARGIELVNFYAEGPASFPAAFAAMRRAGVQALAILSAPELFSNTPTLTALALEAGMPTVCEWGSMAVQGCLLGYGPSWIELQSRTAGYVARIFRGAAPGELPIEGPTRYEMVVNLKTAHSLGLALPPAVLARADAVVE
jgi:putative ABC transport system substrate-binding protein